MRVEDTDECKQFSRLTVYERSGMEESAETRASVNILEIVYKINMCLR